MLGDSKFRLVLEEGQGCSGMTDFTWKCVRECFMQTGRADTQNRLVLKQAQYSHTEMLSTVAGNWWLALWAQFLKLFLGLVVPVPNPCAGKMEAGEPPV